MADKDTLSSEEKTILLDDEAHQKEIAEIFKWFEENKVRIDLSKQVERINFDLIVEALELAGIMNRVSFQIEHRRRFLGIMQAVKTDIEGKMAESKKTKLTVVSQPFVKPGGEMH